jgi:hypothetical protein
MVALRRRDAGRGSEKCDGEHDRSGAFVGWRGCHDAGPKTTYIPNEILPHFPLKKTVVIFLLLGFAPIAASAARYFWLGDGRGNWQTEDRLKFPGLGRFGVAAGL